MAKKTIQKGFRQKFTKVKTAKGRRASSTKWLQRQLNDPYVLMAREKNYRARSAFKIIEIDEKFKLIRDAKVILDLGCAPGGWLQICQELNAKAKLIGIDLLEIEPLAKVDFIQGDFLELEIQEKLIKILKGDKIDLILSDMSPSTSGHKQADNFRLLELLEQVLEFSKGYLSEDGNLVAKIFKGVGSDELLRQLKLNFKNVKIFKPDSSRKESKEEYVVCQKFKKV